MKDIGILFKGPMVRAILEDRKTKTRRIPTYMNTLVDGKSVGKKVWDGFEFDFRHAFEFPDGLPIPFGGAHFRVPSDAYGRTFVVQPKWEIGDLLWVRENMVCKLEGEGPYFDVIFPADGTHHDENAHPEAGLHCDWFEAYRGWYNEGLKEQKIPGIHMPRWACRIEADITSVGAERIQEITEEEAIAEGVYDYPINEWTSDIMLRLDGLPARDIFIQLWDSINYKRGYGWETNWPVWVFGFERRGK